MANIPPATVARLPLYLRSLASLPSDRPTCSSEELAQIAGVQSAQVRKDLSLVGLRGVRGVGYDIDCDGQINPVDSGIVQSLFGTCEAPREVCP